MSSTKNIHITMDDNGVKLSVCSRLAKEYMQKRANEELDNKINTKEREENNMEVVKLYYARKREDMRDFFKDKEEKLMNDNTIIKEFNAIQNKFINEMETLMTKEGASEVITKTPYVISDTRYEIRDSFVQNIRKELQDEFETEMKDIESERKEVLALLELSDDLEYRLNVLREYGIVDKKGKMC